MAKVFLIVTSKLISNFSFFYENYFISLRDLLTSMGKPDERLSDVEVIDKNLSTSFSLFFVNEIVQSNA
jgi:hypothetical protein